MDSLRTSSQRPLRLLQVATSFVTLRAFLLPFAKHFRSQGWQVDGAADGVSTSLECEDTYDHVHDVQWSRNPLSLTNLRDAPRRMRQIVLEGKYDIVHVHTPVAAFVTRMALRKLRISSSIRIIYTAHGFHFHRGSSGLRNSIYQRLEKAAGRHTDYLVTINQEDFEAAKRLRIVQPDHVWYMPGIGVDPGQYDPSSISVTDVISAREKLGLKKQDRLFLMVAEFNPGKRHVDLLRALASVNRQDVHLALAGEGPLMGQMRQLAKELGIADRVHFLGFCRDLPVWIRASFALVAPSQREGLPRCIMEAMCLELPVIASRIRGQEDLLEGECGILFPVADVAELTHQLVWALEHPSELKQMAQHARSRMDDYETSHIIELHEKLYHVALAEGGRVVPVPQESQ